MDAQRHDEVMRGIMGQLDKDDLNLADGITIWHSLGVFLFSNIDKENKDISKIYDQMSDYLNDMKNMKSDTK
jgi:hypothetical protein